MDPQQQPPSSKRASRAPRSELTEFAELVVRDYLRSRGLDKALAAFDEDCRDAEPEPPSVESWYSLSGQLDLPSLLQNNALNESLQHGTILEVLVSQLLAEESTKRRGPVSVSVLHGTESLEFQLPRPADAIPAPAPVEPGLSRTISGAHSDAAIGIGEATLSHTLDASDLPLSAPESLPEGSVAGKGCGSKRADRNKQRRRAGQASSSQYTSPALGSGSNLLRKKPAGNRKSDEAWIPTVVRHRFVERQLSTAKVNLDSRNKRAAIALTNARRQTLSDLEQNHAEEQYKIKRKKQCGLCFREYSAINMALSVPNKAVFDLQSTWEEKNTWISMTDNQKRKYQNPVKQKPSALYNEVPICTYCSQFFKHGQQDVYRPSYESKVKERRERSDKLAAEQAKAYWDPLTTIETLRKAQLDNWERTQPGGGTPTPQA